ncbi:MAG: phosphoglucosamine mutase [Candidatus Falkowbacteria bacterium]
MPLITSISGLRGTIGGAPGENLTPLDAVKFTAAFVSLLKEKYNSKITIVVGRDARISGLALKHQVISTLQFCGASVIDLDLATTPTVEMMVTESKAQGGIILTASHNPKEWNALKLLDAQGEFISAADGEKLLAISQNHEFNFVSVDELGVLTLKMDSLNYHLQKILELPLVNVELIRAANFSVAVDGINSVGGIAIPELLKELGVKNIYKLNCEPTGDFAHNPEPLAEHLTDICALVKDKQADLGIVVDPDVDRLAFIDEKGIMFGEEYTLVAVADYILENYQGAEYNKAAVSNLSSSRALKDIALKHDATYEAAAVGEVNVVAKMKNIKAVIGGEGNGGIIYPELHYGRDALVGVALFLTYLAKKKITVSQLRAQYPGYIMIKHKLTLIDRQEINLIFDKLKSAYSSQRLDEQDGLKIEWADAWVHMRPSNTEAIMRLYIEAPDEIRAGELLTEILANIK